jgi:hypothetical protein
VELLLVGLGGVVCLASGIGMTTFSRRPEVRGPLNEAVEGAREPRRPSLLGRAVRLAESIGKFFIHYPSYIWIAAVASDARIFLYPYAAVNALYAARSMLGLVLRFGGPAPRAALDQREPERPS